VAAPAAYGYRLAPPGAFPRAGRVKLPPLMVVGGLLLILVVGVAVISLFAASRGFGTHSTCTSDCGPKVGTQLLESNTFRSVTFRFQVDYSSSWKVLHQDASSISLGTKIGRVDIVGSSSSQSLVDLINGTVSALPSSSWQGVTKVSDLKGAHIGDQDGLGAIYSAN